MVTLINTNAVWYNLQKLLLIITFRKDVEGSLKNFVLVSLPQ
jgi:hypothetical protein